jgi:hypothetical protein
LLFSDRNSKRFKFPISLGMLPVSLLLPRLIDSGVRETSG